MSQTKQEHNYKKSLWISRWFTAIGMVLFTFQTFWTGWDIGQHHYKSGTLDGLLGLFWGGFLVVMYLTARQDGEIKMLDYVIETMEEEHERASHKKSKTDDDSEGPSLYTDDPETLTPQRPGSDRPADAKPTKKAG